MAGDARVDKSGSRDAAVVVAVDRREALPRLPGVRVSGEDWVRFFPNVLGVPGERVTPLFDAAATPAAISSAVRTAAARVAPGGRLWFVAIGYAVVDEHHVATAARATTAQIISVLDAVPRDADPTRVTVSPARPGALPGIVFSRPSPLPLPGASRPALSYLLMGALRGWGDRDHDGRITASEAADYVDLSLRLLSPRIPRVSERRLSARSELVCSELTTLSVAREPAPNLLAIAPRVPPGRRADPEQLAIAREAVRAVDTQLAMAGTAVLTGPRFIGQGEQRQLEIVPMPNEVAATLRVRLEQAQQLGGAVVPEAAALLVEAGQLSYAYGLLDEARRILTPVLEARCGADAAGHQAWLWLRGMSTKVGQGEDTASLVSMDCAYDEASASAIDAGLRLIRGVPRVNEKAWPLYRRAEQEVDATLARCTWSAVADEYSRSWWTGSKQLEHVEAALNGGYALQRLARNDEAAALYRSFVQRHRGAAAGESKRHATERRAYAVAACSVYLSLARSEPRLIPGYFDACKDVDCQGLDLSTCRNASSSVPAQLLDSGSAGLDGAWRLSLEARDRQELAGWEPTETARAERLREASDRYAAAGAAWAALAGSGAAIPDAAEVARRRAEAAVRQLGVELELGVEVTEQRVETARQLARWARDVSSDERRAEPARLLVELADSLLAREERRGGATRAELPPPVAAAIAARDEYLAAVPATFDAAQVRYVMAYEAGRLQFLYGHFAQARQRLELPYAMKCGVSPVGHEAWVLLLSMANLKADVQRARSLASDEAVCAIDVETRIAADRLRKPVPGVPFSLEGRRQLQASEGLPQGPERRALRREAAAIFRQFVNESPDRDEAPEAARLAAELYAELDEKARALEMYRLFLDRYAGEAKASVADVEKAYAALATLHAELGDYRAAARVLLEQTQQKRLPSKVRDPAEQRAQQLRKHREGLNTKK